MSRTSARHRKPSRRSYDRPSTYDRPSAHDRPRSPDRPSAFDRPRSYDRPSAFERPRSYDRPSTYDRPRSYDRPSALDRSRSYDRPSALDRSRSYDRPSAFDRSRSYDHPGEYDLPGQYGLPGAYDEPDPYDQPSAYDDRREYTGRGGYAEPDEYDDQDEYDDDPRAYDGQHGYAQDEYDEQDEYEQDEYEYAQDEQDGYAQDEYDDPRAYDLPASHDRPATYDHPAAYDDQDEDDEQDDGYDEPGQHDRDRPSAYNRLSTGHRRRKARPITSVLQNRPAKVAAAAVAGSALMVAAWPAASHLLTTAHHAGVDQADALGLPGAGPKAAPTVKPTASRGTHTRPQPEILGISVASRPGKHRKPGQAMPPGGYMNPLRSVSGLVPERIDEGVDFAGTGAVYAIGDGVVTTADGTNGGWPGGGWITYRLTDGADAGLTVYVAEDVTPTVQVGQHVTPSTVIANMWNGGDGIETGWADSGALSAESQQAAAGGIGGYGPFPTMVGLNFDELLQSLGVPAAPNSGQAASGLLPAGYPSWG